MYCTQCGQPIEEGENFCGFCGAPVMAYNSSQIPSGTPGDMVGTGRDDMDISRSNMTQTEPESKRGKKKVLLSIVAAAAVLVTVGVFVFFRTIGGDSSDNVRVSDYASPELSDADKIEDDNSENAANDTGREENIVEPKGTGEGDNTSIDAYLLSAGITYSQKLIEMLPIYEENYSNTNYRLIAQTKQVLEDQRLYSAVLISYDFEMFFEDFADEELKEAKEMWPYYALLSEDYMKRSRGVLIRSGIGDNYFSGQSPDSEEYLENFFLSGISVNVPIAVPDGWEDSLMFIFFGEKESPDAGVLIFFSQREKNIGSAYISFMGKSLSQSILEDFPEWFVEGTWYSQEDLLAAQKSVESDQRAVEKIEVADMNEYMIETAKELNEQFYNKLSLALDSFLALDDEEKEEIDWDYLEFVQDLMEASKSFDLGMVVTTDMPYFSSYYLIILMDYIGVSPTMGGTLMTYYPALYTALPEEWLSDTMVLLGSENADYFALVEFQEIDTFTYLYESNNVQSVSYYLFPLKEEQSFLDVQEILASYEFIMKAYGQEGTFSFASPYGSWTSFDGIQNLYQEWLDR